MIDEPSLAALVARFYARARQDPALGPVFERAIDDWPAHLDKITAFWSSVMLGSGRYQGQPLPAHMRHRGALSPALFQRWLQLWAETARAELPPAAAAAVIGRAQRIGASMQIALFDLLPARPGAAPSIIPPGGQARGGQAGSPPASSRAWEEATGGR